MALGSTLPLREMRVQDDWCIELIILPSSRTKYWDPQAPAVLRLVKLVGHLARMGLKLNKHKFLVVHAAAQRPFTTCRCT